MSTYVTVRPFLAKSKKDATKPAATQSDIQAHYDTDKDFIIADLFHGEGRHVNKTDARKNGLILSVRYANDTKVYNVRP